MTADDGDPTGLVDLRALDTKQPNPARMYDYYLGGAHNLAVDREAADKVLAVLPETRTFARHNRAFMRRAVRYLVGEAGITQLLDLGSGIPTEGNAHEIAQGIDPDARVVYVDHEPVAVQTAKALLSDNPNAVMLGADLRRPDAVLGHPETRRLLDFTQPIAVLMISVFPFIPDSDDPAGIIAAYRAACSPGSYLALSHSLNTDYWPGAVDDAVELYSNTSHPLNLRTPEQIVGMFAGYELVEPGVVFTSAWRPDQPVTDEQAAESRAVAGVGYLRNHSTETSDNDGAPGR